MNAHELMVAGYNQFKNGLKVLYGLDGTLSSEGPFTTDDKTLTAFIELSGTRGKIIFEVHEAAGSQSLWMCLPHPEMERTHLWYEFVANAQGKLKAQPNPHLLSTAYPGWTVGGFGNSDPWSGGGTYWGMPGDDPPHWSPIFVVDNVKDSPNGKSADRFTMG